MEQIDMSAAGSSSDIKYRKKYNTSEKISLTKETAKISPLEDIDINEHKGTHEKAICNIVANTINTNNYQAIIEVLYIQGDHHDKSFTCIKGNSQDINKAGEVMNCYLEVIKNFPEQVEEELKNCKKCEGMIQALKTHKTVTVFDDLYFDDNLFLLTYCSGAQTESLPQNGNDNWVIYGEKFEKYYSPTGGGEQIDNKDCLTKMLLIYANQIYRTCFKVCNWLRILLVPIAFAGNKHKDYQEKLGMVFLHLGGNKEPPDPVIFESIYRQIVLYWHDKISADLIAEHRQVEERASGRAMLYDSIKGPVDELTALLHQAQKPLSDLTSVTSPMKQFVTSGPFLAPFFGNGEVTLSDFGYKDPSLVKEPIKTTHTFQTGNINTYKDLIPAILLRALGETENARDPLWDCLRAFLISPSPRKKSLADGISKTLPVLKEEWNDNATITKKFKKEIGEAFDYTKDWFNTSYKPNKPLHGSLLLLTANILGIQIKRGNIPVKRGNIPELRILVVSRPVDTVAAINSIHQQYDIEELAVTRKKPYVTLRLKLNKAHGMNRTHAGNLYEDICAALQDESLPRGSTTSILHQLFYSPEIKGKNPEGIKNIFQVKDTIFTYNGFSLKFCNENIIQIRTTYTVKKTGSF